MLTIDDMALVVELPDKPNDNPIEDEANLVKDDEISFTIAKDMYTGTESELSKLSFVHGLF